MKKCCILLLTALMLLRLPMSAAANSSDSNDSEPFEVTDSTDTSPSESINNEEPGNSDTTPSSESVTEPETTPKPDTSSESENTSEPETTPKPETTPQPKPPESSSTTNKEPEPEGIQFIRNGTTLTECIGSSNKAIIPDDIEFISAGAFDKVQDLQVIVVYNFNCKVAPGAFPKNVTVYSYKNSSAYEEAQRVGLRVTELARKDVTLTINYIRYDGAPIAKPHTEPLKTGDQYLVISPSKPGLVPDIKEVQGYASREDITITVTYSVSTDDKWTIDGSYIKYTENGSFLKNTSKTIDGKTYRFNASGQLELNDSFVTIKGNTYYLVNNRITTGYKVIGSAIYFFTDNGIMLVNSTRDGHRFDSDGTLSGEDGTINIGDKTYYLKGNSLYSGFIEQEGIIYYFGDDFSMVKGDTYGTFKFNGLGHLVDGITIDGLIFSSVPNVEYTGEEQKPSVTVKFGNITLTEGIHFNLVYSNNVDPGKATVEINGIGAVSGSKELNFTIIGEEAFTLTIRYVNPADQPVAPDYVSMYAPGDEYLVYCPHVPGYIAENAVTEGKMPKSDVTITVIYTPEIIEPVNPDTDSDSNFESEPADTKPTISSSIIEVEGTSKTNIERQDIVTKTYNWDLLVIVFLVATVICGGSILLIINWDYIKRYLVKRHRTKRS